MEVLKNVLRILMLLEPSQSRVCQGERNTTPSWNISVSPLVQLPITVSVTGSSFRGAHLVREKLCTSKPHRLSLLITQGKSPSLAQQPKTGMICSLAFISCSWERRTWFLVNHMLALVTQYWPCVLCPGMRQQCWHPLRAAHLNSSLGEVSHRGPSYLYIWAWHTCWVQ